MQPTPKHSRLPRNVSRKTIQAVAVLLLAVGLLTGCTSGPAPKSSDAALAKLDTNELKMTILADISSTILSDEGLDSSIKADIAHQITTPLLDSSEVQVVGDDAITRPVAVDFQKAFEQSLMNAVDKGQLSHAVAIIHTRKPTTPLCNPAGKALRQTMSVSMQDDPNRVKTIEDRTITLRRMAQGGPLIDLYVAYIKGGLNKRSPEEQQIYKKEINNPADTSLHDAEMACTEMPDDIVGASYVLTTKRGNTLYFGTNGTQAADAAGSTVWRFWFGSLKNTSVERRYQEVFQYLNGCGLGIPFK